MEDTRNLQEPVKDEEFTLINLQEDMIRCWNKMNKEQRMSHLEDTKEYKTSGGAIQSLYELFESSLDINIDESVFDKEDGE